MRPLNAQSKKLREQLFIRFVLAFILYTLGMFALYGIFETYISPAVGNVIAETTSEWVETSMEEFDQASKDHRMIQTDLSNRANSPGEPSTIHYRTLDTYAFFKVLKDDSLPIIFVAGIAGLIAFFLNKFVHYFDELSSSVAALFADKSTPVMLSKDLAIVQYELNGIRSESIQNERRAKETEAKKNKLITYIAHDARTPLTSIMGYLAMLKEPQLPSEEKRISYASIAYDQAHNLNKLLDELFTIARFNIQGTALTKRPTDIRTLCLQVGDEFYPALEEKRLTLELTVPLGIERDLDPEKMARAIGNIMRNAVYYATEGSTIEVNAQEHDGALTLSVTNSGKTIAPENLERIFDQFYRENEARTAHGGSAGLGLAITKEIVVAHGGAVCATSAEGRTTITITLPAPDEEAPELKGGAHHPTLERLRSHGCRSLLAHLRQS